MVMLIIVFAAIFSHVIALIGAPKALLGTVIALGLPKWALFTVIFSFILVIAYALEELSVMIILLPILFPLITAWASTRSPSASSWWSGSRSASSRRPSGSTSS